MTNLVHPTTNRTRGLPGLAEATAQLTSWIEVDLAAQTANVVALRASFGGAVEIIAVVKANAYGAGIEGVAPALEAAGIDRFAVVWLDEALYLREIGITRPILVLGHTPAARAAEAVRAHLALTCDSFALGLALSEAASIEGSSATVHLHIDSGLNRDGLTPAGAVELARVLAPLPYLTIEGLSTHMANADEDDDSFSDAQFATFSEAAAELDWIRYHHAANSASAIRRAGLRLNGVRIGLALHGVLPENTGARLTPVLALRARVIRVHDVAVGEGASYGLTWRAQRPSRLALIPVGYADGWRRGLGNAGAVLINGRRCPMVGRVCMDQFVVDVTDSGAVAVGDVATLIGEQDGTRISAEEVAVTAETIPWDVLASLQPRLPRIFHSHRGVELITESGGRRTHYLALEPPSTV